MIETRRGGTIFGISAALLLAVLDRLLKTLVEQPYFNSAHIGWRYFAFERFHNMGIAFSLPIPLWLVLPLTGVFLIALVIWTRKNPTAWTYVALAALFLGAASNGFDRIAYGFTIDYLRIINGIINIADILVLAGISMLLLAKNKK